MATTIDMRNSHGIFSLFSFTGPPVWPGCWWPQRWNRAKASAASPQQAALRPSGEAYFCHKNRVLRNTSLNHKNEEWRVWTSTWSPWLWWSLTLHESAMTTLKSIKFGASGWACSTSPDSGHCSGRKPGQIFPLTHHWPTIHPRPMESQVLFGCFNQGTVHDRCKLHRELVGLIGEECLLHRSCTGAVFFGGAPCSLSKMDGLWWKILWKFYWI